MKSEELIMREKLKKFGKGTFQWENRRQKKETDEEWRGTTSICPNFSTKKYPFNKDHNN